MQVQNDCFEPCRLGPICNQEQPVLHFNGKRLVLPVLHFNGKQLISVTVIQRSLPDVDYVESTVAVMSNPERCGNLRDLVCRAACSYVAKQSVIRQLCYFVTLVIGMRICLILLLIKVVVRPCVFHFLELSWIPSLELCSPYPLIPGQQTLLTMTD